MWDVDRELNMMNKMIDMAVCGRVILTPEIHKTAIEKYGIVNRWRRMYLLYDSLRLAWKNDAMMKTVNSLRDKYALHADEFDTPRSLYNTISKKYREIFQVGAIRRVSL